MRSTIVLFLGLLSTFGFGQEFYAAPNQAMGNSGLALSSVYSLSHNASTVTQLKKTTVALAYQPHFLSTSIQSQALYLIFPIQASNSVGFGINNYGLKGTSSLMTVRGAYSRSFGKRISSSITANYHQYQVKSYGLDRAFSMDLGFHFILQPSLSLGAFARNISSAKFDDTIDQYIPQEGGLGMAYQISKELLVVTDLFYNTINGFEPRAGISYLIDKLFVARVGARANPLQYSAGAGVHLDKVWIDISSTFGAKVGYAPQLAISYGF